MNERVQRAAVDLHRDLQRLEPLIAVAGSDDSVYSQLAATLDRCLDQLRRTNLVGIANKTESSVLWTEAGHLLSRGWLQERVRSKPRGYPGDYELLARFYDRRLCDDPLGRLFDRYFLEQPAPRAVENRMRMIAAWTLAALRERGTRPLRVAIVGSAFGLELCELLQTLQPRERQRLHITLLDLDPLALDFAHGVLAPLLPPENLTLEINNPLRLLTRPQLAAKLNGSDLIFCPGVFDYLDDAEASALLRILFDRLAPGGRMTVFQFAPHDPTRAYMEWIGQWHLIYREEAELRAFVRAAQLDSAELVYGAEPLGVDLFVTAGRASRAQ